MKKRIYVGLLAVATATSLVACSSSGTSKKASSATTSSANTTPIKILTLGEYTGALFGYPEMKDATKAAVAAANAAGGINGHQIELTTCDDKGDPNVAAACARQAVTEHVTAVVGSISLFAANITPLLEAAKIPYIGALPVAAQDSSSPIDYPVDGGGPVVYSATSLGLIKAGCKKIGILASDNGASAPDVVFITKGAQSGGGSITKVEKVPTGAPDFTPYVTALLQSGPDCVALVINTTDMVKVVTALRQSSKPNILISSGLNTLPPAIVQGLHGGANGMQAPAGAYNPGPQTPTFIAQLKAENASAPADNPAETAWSAATTFIDVAKNITGDITAASVLAQLNKTTALKLETYPAPIDFSKTSSVPGSPHLFNFSALTYVVKGSDLVLPDTKPINSEAALAGK